MSKLYDVFQIQDETREVKQGSKGLRQPLFDLEEQLSHIFVVTKQHILHIISLIQFKKVNEGEVQTHKPLLTSKKIERVYNIKHIDFIEIAGDDNKVLLIGFRQN